jgi:hypothetical protein
MKNTFLYIFVSILFLASCKNAPAPVEQDDFMVYGENFDHDKAISYEKTLSQLATQDSVVATLSANVESVCQAKGCWMNVYSDKNPEAEQMFVKFKDYGFFMPLDLKGEVIMTGKAYREITSVDELRHYAEDEGKSAEEIAAITEPTEELKFMASGVKIKKKA